MEYSEFEEDIKQFKDASVDYFKLKVVSQAHQFIQEIYRVTEHFPSHEKFGLTSQVRRASTSINLNIIEGKYRSTKKEFVRFLEISRGSCAETNYLLRLSKDLGYLPGSIFDDLIEKNTQIWKMVNAMISHFKKTNN